MYTHIIRIYLCIYGRFSFVGWKAPDKGCTLLSHSLVLLNFGGQKRSGAFDTVWPSANLFSTTTVIAPWALTQQTCQLCDTSETSAV